MFGAEGNLSVQQVLVSSDPPEIFWSVVVTDAIDMVNVHADGRRRAIKRFANQSGYRSISLATPFD
jgi:hypothetical protein